MPEMENRFMKCLIMLAAVLTIPIVCFAVDEGKQSRCVEEQLLLPHALEGSLSSGSGTELEEDRLHGGGANLQEPRGIQEFRGARDNLGIQESFGALPLYFIQNQGQINHEEVAYYVKGADKTLYFTPSGITFVLTEKYGKSSAPWVLKLDFLGANAEVRPVGEVKKKATFNFFKGARKEWSTGISTYSQLVYPDLWPGIDLVYSGTANQLKYEFRVNPGADPNKIRLAYRGAESVEITDAGELKVTTPAGGFEDGKPLAYQMIDGNRIELSMEYALDPDSMDPVVSYGFDLGPYDPSAPLILDPVLLLYCGYIGGDEDDVAHAVAVDSQGCAYVTGTARSLEGTFPVAVGPDLTFNGGYYGDAFIAKVSADGTHLEYCGYIGGGEEDAAYSIAVDSENNAYIAGYTLSTEVSFPVAVGPDLTFNSMRDSFVAKISADGTDLEYCGYIGGALYDTAEAVAVDGEGCAYVTGYTSSSQFSFPVTVGPDLTISALFDAFVAKVSADGTHLEYCGYIGGEETELAYDIALDDESHAYVVGYTGSSEATFPVVVGPDLTFNGGHESEIDAFVAKVNAAGTHLDYCGYIGGTKDDAGYGIAVDPEGNAYVTGNTDSDESSMPVCVGPDLTHNDGWAGDAFVAKVNTDGTHLDYCGFIGGDDTDAGYDIAVDSFGNAYVAGLTESTETTFPIVFGPDISYNGITDGFIARVNVAGTHLDYCGYIGGEHFDYIYGIAVDNLGAVYVGGFTASDHLDDAFPVVVGPDLTFNGGGAGYGDGDAFIAKVAPALHADTETLTEGQEGLVNFSLHTGLVNAGRKYILLGSTEGTVPGLVLPGGMATLPLNWDSFTSTIFYLLNTPMFCDFMGTLDIRGQATALLNTLGPMPPGSAGYSLDFAFALNKPWDFASNPVSVEVLP